MKEIVFAIGMMLVVGCTCCGTKNATPPNDGYVPWWVEDGVANGDGEVAEKPM